MCVALAPLARAARILPVVKNQHLLLCTLLIGNSLAMEALPIFLDTLVPPYVAILISVTLILAFGEVLYLLSFIHLLIRFLLLRRPFVLKNSFPSLLPDE